jgi:hypothetical protein
MFPAGDPPGAAQGEAADCEGEGFGGGLWPADGKGDGLTAVPPNVHPASATTTATAPTAAAAWIDNRLGRSGSIKPEVTDCGRPSAIG